MTEEDLAEVLPQESPGIVEIRKFSDASIQGAIDRAIAALPPDATGTVVAHANTHGASLSVLAKLPGGHWSIVAAAYKPYDGPMEAGAAVRFKW